MLCVKDHTTTAAPAAAAGVPQDVYELAMILVDMRRAWCDRARAAAGEGAAAPPLQAESTPGVGGNSGEARGRKRKLDERAVAPSARPRRVCPRKCLCECEAACEPSAASAEPYLASTGPSATSAGPSWASTRPSLASNGPFREVASSPEPSDSELSDESDSPRVGSQGPSRLRAAPLRSRVSLQTRAASSSTEDAEEGTDDDSSEVDMECVSKCKDYTKATRDMLSASFSKSVLATHSLSGRPSPAFRERAAKPPLPRAAVERIVAAVCRRYRVQPHLVRKAITVKCSDENKMMRLNRGNRQARKYLQ